MTDEYKEKYCSTCKFCHQSDKKASHKVIRVDLKESIPICLCDSCYNHMRSGCYSYCWKDVD